MYVTASPLLVNDIADNFIVSICGVFWFHLNKGQWFSSPLKIFLSVINLIIILIGGLVVSTPFLDLALF